MQKTITSHKPLGLSSFGLHLLAMTFMFFDHAGKTVLTQFPWLIWIGRLAFPLFAFMIAEGFFHTKGRKRYGIRMLIFALISELPYNLMTQGAFFAIQRQNVLWTFVFAIGLLHMYEEVKQIKQLAGRLVLEVLATVAFCLLAEFAATDYGGEGVMTVVLFHLARLEGNESPKEKAAVMGMQAAGMVLIHGVLLAGATLPFRVLGVEVPIQGLAVFALPLIWLYNGRQGPYNAGIKYMYYLFYPVHQLVLAVGRMLL